MGFYRGPNIVTDGLVLALDIASPRCYPGSGTILNDISKTTSAITVNTPTYVTTNVGGLQCSTNEFIVADDVTATDYVTVDVFYKRDANEGGEDIVFNKESCWEIRDDNGNVQNAVMANNQSWFWYDTGIDVSVGETVNLTLVYDGNDVKTYKNGTLQHTRDYPNGGVLANQSSAYPKFNSRGSGKTSVQNPGNRTLFIYNIYNRALSQSEITQNYNALKGRFGL
jgi:hypothetical protein